MLPNHWVEDRLVEAVSTQIEEIASKSTTVQSSSTEMVEIIEQVNTSTQESSSVAEQMSNSSEEMNKALD